MGDASSFLAGIDRIKEQVGYKVDGKVEVDQVYAAPQHDSTWMTGPLAGHVIRKHPGGGGGLFLSTPLAERSQSYLDHLQDNVFEEGGLMGAMVDNMEDLSAEVARLAPDEYGDLRASGHPSVTVDGAVVYDRPPAVPRLDPDALHRKRAHRSNRQPGLGELMTRRNAPALPRAARMKYKRHFGPVHNRPMEQSVRLQPRERQPKLSGTPSLKRAVNARQGARILAERARREAEKRERAALLEGRRKGGRGLEGIGTSIEDL